MITSSTTSSIPTITSTRRGAEIHLRGAEIHVRGAEIHVRGAEIH